jgi:hypothetical protein
MKAVAPVPIRAIMATTSEANAATIATAIVVVPLSFVGAPTATRKSNEFFHLPRSIQFTAQTEGTVVI